MRPYPLLLAPKIDGSPRPAPVHLSQQPPSASPSTCSTSSDTHPSPIPCSQQSVIDAYRRRVRIDRDASRLRRSPPQLLRKPTPSVPDARAGLLDATLWDLARGMTRPRGGGASEGLSAPTLWSRRSIPEALRAPDSSPSAPDAGEDLHSHINESWARAAPWGPSTFRVCEDAAALGDGRRPLFPSRFGPECDSFGVAVCFIPCRRWRAPNHVRSREGKEARSHGRPRSRIGVGDRRIYCTSL
ncbi:hypothetical protein DFH09DRAFT_444957 [Mycena vulgaris]|nr:hypothetical protein DFH09DRAFT_444957 [Mycena vulgaris]